jgi:hypothetical protein
MRNKIKKIVCNLVLLGLLLSDVIYKIEGFGNVFIGFNIFNFIIYCLVIMTVLVKPEDKSLEPLKKPTSKISIIFDTIILLLLLYFGWWFNSIIWAFGIGIMITLKELFKQEAEKCQTNAN